MKPRVCLVATTTAAERGDVLAASVRGLVDAGWDARLFCKGESWARDPALRDPALAGRTELSPARKAFPIPPALHRRPVELARYLRAPGETGHCDDRLLELRPHLIHFHSGWSAWRGMRLKGILGCRVVVSFRADGQDLRVPDPSLLWEADRFVFPDQAALERAAAEGCPPERAEVFIPPLSPGRNGHRVSGAPLRLLSAAPVVWEQGLEHSVHAVRLLLDMGVDCEYRVVGVGDHLVAVAFARHQLGLADHVELLAPDGGNPLIEALKTTDVLVDPAVADTASSASLEMAQSLGIPFVATPRDGLPADAGIAVPRRDAAAIADALATLAADPELRDRMGEAGRRHVRGYPTVDEHVVCLEDLYRRALA